MKNERINLTPGYCRDLKAKDKEYFVKDLNCPGLWLRIYPSGFKCWYYHYRPKGGKNNLMKYIVRKRIMADDKDMRKMSNIVENLIRRYVESRV